MAKKVIIRAVPAGHHQTRHGAQRPWSSDRVTVVVKDDAKPAFTTSRADTGHELKHHFQHREITPAELAELMADPHFVVCERVDELNAALAKLATQRAAVQATEAVIAELERR